MIKNPTGNIIPLSGVFLTFFKKCFSYVCVWMHACECAHVIYAGVHCVQKRVLNTLGRVTVIET